MYVPYSTEYLPTMPKSESGIKILPVAKKFPYLGEVLYVGRQGGPPHIQYGTLCRIKIKL
jgi:hypothetical protein